jgi:hypothetical protein
MNTAPARAPRIPVILLIDVEPDPFLVNRRDPEPWKGYEATYPYLAALRQPIADATGAPAHFTWCFRMDHQVEVSYGSRTHAVDRYPEFISEMAREGDGFGTHTHAYRWVEERGTWLEDLANQEWVNECVETSLQAHARAFGAPCEIFRFGNFWINTATINRLEKLGVRYDLTIEPGLASNRRGTLEKGYSTGERPDYCRISRSPYEPGRDDFLRPAAPGTRSIKMIPLTSAWLRLGWNVRARLRRLRDNGLRHRRQSERLSMWKPWPPPNGFDQMLDRAIAAQEKPYLCFAIRSSIGAGKASARVDHCLRTLMTHRERHRFVFATPAEAMALLEGRVSR